MRKIIVVLLIIGMVGIVAAADTFASLSETHDAISWSVEKDQINATWHVQKWDERYNYFVTVYGERHSYIIFEEQIKDASGSYLFPYDKLEGTYYINLQERDASGAADSRNLDITEFSMGAKSLTSDDYAKWLVTKYSCNDSSFLSSGSGYI